MAADVFNPATVAVGDTLPRLTRRVTRTTIFIFSAAYYGTHRFHYDVESARAEGFDDVIVTANLVCSYFEQAVRRYTGDASCLRVLEERSMAPAFAGVELAIDGAVTAVNRRDGETAVSCDLIATDQHGRTISTCRVELLAGTTAG